MAYPKLNEPIEIEWPSSGRAVTSAHGVARAPWPTNHPEGHWRDEVAHMAAGDGVWKLFGARSEAAGAGFWRRF